MNPNMMQGLSDVQRLLARLELLEAENRVLKEQLFSKEQQESLYFGKDEEEKANTVSYDVVINARGISELNDGWEIEISPESKERLKTESIIVSVDGHENKGKSFLLSKLTNKQLPKGFHVHTKGLSIILPPNPNVPVTFLDKKGMEGPITRKCTSEVTIEGSIQDRSICEYIMQSFILQVANLIIIVVAQLTFADQRYIARVLKLYKGKKDKRIFIVHNLHTLNTKKVVEQTVKNGIFASGELAEREYLYQGDEGSQFASQNKVYFADRSDNSIHHLILAREGSEAGEYYNAPAFNYLLKCIMACSARSMFNPVERLCNYVNETLPQYLISGLPKVEPLVRLNEPPTGKSIIQFCNKINPVSLKTIHFDALESLFLTSSEEDAPSHLLRIFDSKLILTVDLPAWSAAELSAIKGCILRPDSQHFAIKLTGERSSFDEPGETLSSTRRNKLAFTTVRIPHATCLLISKPPQKEISAGRITFSWELS